MPKSSVLRRFWIYALKPLLAWLAACWVAGFTLFFTYLVADNGLGEGLSRQGLGAADPFLAALIMLPFIATVTAIPAFILVHLARRRSWPRGRAEALAGALIPFIFFSFFFGSQYNSLEESWQGLMIAATFVPGGVAGGLTYWWLVGRQETAQ